MGNGRSPMYSRMCPTGSGSSVFPSGSDGCFFKDGDFHMAPGFMLEDLEKIFQYEVFKMLKKGGKITEAVIENMLSWHHSGFHVYIGDRIFSEFLPFRV